MGGRTEVRPGPFSPGGLPDGLHGDRTMKTFSPDVRERGRRARRLTLRDQQTHSAGRRLQSLKVLQSASTPLPSMPHSSEVRGQSLSGSSPKRRSVPESWTPHIQYGFFTDGGRHRTDRGGGQVPGGPPTPRGDVSACSSTERSTDPKNQN